MATDYRIPANKLVRPDKDRFLDEENPFEAMMSRFDKAAELLDLEPGMYKVLRHPEKQIVISIPVMMDNGQVDVFEGYRVLYNTSRGPAKGGIRFDMRSRLRNPWVRLCNSALKAMTDIGRRKASTVSARW